MQRLFESIHDKLNRACPRICTEIIGNYIMQSLPFQGRSLRLPGAEFVAKLEIIAVRDVA